jgi:hypothetical protein
MHRIVWWSQVLKYVKIRYVLRYICIRYCCLGSGLVQKHMEVGRTLVLSPSIYKTWDKPRASRLECHINVKGLFWSYAAHAISVLAIVRLVQWANSLGAVSMSHWSYAALSWSNGQTCDVAQATVANTCSCMLVTWLPCKKHAIGNDSIRFRATSTNTGILTGGCQQCALLTGCATGRQLSCSPQNRIK